MPTTPSLSFSPALGWFVREAAFQSESRKGEKGKEFQKSAVKSGMRKPFAEEQR